MAIQSFRCNHTRRLFETGKSQKFGSIRDVAMRKLAMLDNAPTLRSLESPPGNHFKEMVYDRKGQHSIRISELWRLCFVWTEAGPTEVEITNHYA
jgi:proteic killer suppression protein